MEEKHLDLLKMALKIGANAISEVNKVEEFYDDVSNDYYCMIEDLEKKLGISLADVF